MNRADFDALMEKVFEKVRDMAKVKGGEYSEEEKDRLSNFKEEAAGLGVHPLVVWNIYVSKHNTLLKKFARAVQEGKELNLSEPIEGRFLDVIVYSILGLALVEEQLQDKQQEVQDGLYKNHANGEFV